MIYLDNGATSFHKPPTVARAMVKALQTCANPGRGGYEPSLEASRVVFSCRQRAGALFDCRPEQVIFTSSCTHGLNIAIHSLVQPGSRVLISGFEHNAVIRPLHLAGAQVIVAGRRLFDQGNTLEEFEKCLRSGVDVAIFTHVSNVFGYILPVEGLAALCHRYGVPFIVDAAQSAGSLDVKLGALGADFIAMPGHKGLLGPQGTGILLCKKDAQPLLAGGTGSESERVQMPEFLPDRLEPGTLNVPGIAGLDAGLRYLQERGIDNIFAVERKMAKLCAENLDALGYRVFTGENQAGTVSFVTDDCEATAQKLSDAGIAVRAGLHCAPLAHESAGTLKTGTVRVSFGHDACMGQVIALCRALKAQ